MKTPGDAMAHVKFLADYIFTPEEDRRSAVKYRAGWQGPVRKQCADKAVAAGKARRVKTPPRRPAPAGDGA